MELVKPTNPPLKDISDDEQHLIDSLAIGVVPIFERSSVIRAELIAHLIKGDYHGWPVKYFVKIVGATIRGELLIGEFRGDDTIVIKDCHFEDNVTLFGSSIRWLSLTDCTFSGQFDGRHLDCHAFNLSRSSFESEISLARATLTDHLTICNVQFSAGFDAAGIAAASIELQEISLRGELNLANAITTGRLVIADSAIESNGSSKQLDYPEGDPAIILSSARVGSISIWDTSIVGTVELDNIHVNGHVSISSLSANCGHMRLTNAKVEGHLSVHTITGSYLHLILNEAAIAENVMIHDFDADTTCTIDMLSAKFTGSLEIYFVCLGGLEADYSDIGGNVLLSAVESSSISFVNVNIAGNLNLYPFTKRFRSDDVSHAAQPPHLDITDTRISGNLCLLEFEDDPVTGLIAAPIIINRLTMDRTIIEGKCDLSAGKFPVENSIESTRSDTPTQHKISAIDARFNRLVMPRNRPAGTVDLSSASAGSYEDFASGWPKRPVHRKYTINNSCLDDTCSLRLNGFTYQHLVNPRGAANINNGHFVPVWKARLAWLYAQPAADLIDHFKPQPWQQLASTLQHEGYEEDAKRISIERRVSYRFSKAAPWRERVVSSMLHLFADYGYNPWKTIVWCLAFIVAFGFVYHLASLDCEMRSCLDATVFVPVMAGDVETSSTGELTAIYPSFGPFHYSLDLFIPIFDLGMESYWHANTNHQFHLDLGGDMKWLVNTGLWLDWIAVFERILGALMVALAISGFTGLLTRSD
ncbi:MAG: hypothetical protein ABW080_08595 [Candidatus Thiodiazotropha sp.]